MYPVSFRVLEDSKKFGRWDKVEFSWRLPTDDKRVESRHVDSQTLEIIGTVPRRDKAVLLERLIVTSLQAERDRGHSLALLKPKIHDFRIEKKPDAQILEEQSRIDQFHRQSDLFIPRPAVPQVACRFQFKYRYSTDDGDREGTCQDWETEATFFKWRELYGESKALKEMQMQFGETLPSRGLYFAMGTHSRYPETWLINGLIQLKETGQASLF